MDELGRLLASIGHVARRRPMTASYEDIARMEEERP